ncbi:uncharacterized protein [Panulirus ornatus]|uniref:uncharacterized protein n=1 Tax=Panulirus ornatus TaxID=150431 RepID=UPI003A83EA7C
MRSIGSDPLAGGAVRSYGVQCIGGGCDVGGGGVAGAAQASSPPHHDPHSHAPPSNCQYWCRTPDDHFYCCRDDYLVDPIEHPGYCPATRAICAPTHKPLPDALPRVDENGVTFPDFPKFCATDGGCQVYEKCCFDRCFRRHMCKFAFSEDGELTYSSEHGIQADVVQHTYAFDPSIPLYS